MKVDSQTKLKKLEEEAKKEKLWGSISVETTFKNGIEHLKIFTKRWTVKGKKEKKEEIT